VNLKKQLGKKGFAALDKKIGAGEINANGDSFDAAKPKLKEQLKALQGNAKPHPDIGLDASHMGKALIAATGKLKDPVVKATAALTAFGPGASDKIDSVSGQKWGLTESINPDLLHTPADSDPATKIVDGALAQLTDKVKLAAESELEELRHQIDQGEWHDHYGQLRIAGDALVLDLNATAITDAICNVGGWLEAIIKLIAKRPVGAHFAIHPLPPGWDSKNHAYSFAFDVRRFAIRTLIVRNTSHSKLLAYVDDAVQTTYITFQVAPTAGPAKNEVNYIVDLQKTALNLEALDLANSHMEGMAIPSHDKDAVTKQYMDKVYGASKYKIPPFDKFAMPKITSHTDVAAAKTWIKGMYGDDVFEKGAAFDSESGELLDAAGATVAYIGSGHVDALAHYLKDLPNPKSPEERKKRAKSTLNATLARFGLAPKE